MQRQRPSRIHAWCRCAVCELQERHSQFRRHVLRQRSVAGFLVLDKCPQWACGHGGLCQHKRKDGCLLCLLCSDLVAFSSPIARSRALFSAVLIAKRRLLGQHFGSRRQQCVRDAFLQLVDRLNGVDLPNFRALSQAHNISSEFTTPAWLIFGTRLESRLRCTHCERLSLKHEMVNNVSVDTSAIRRPLREVAYEAESNTDAEGDLPCARCKMAGARSKELSVQGWVLVVLVNRWVQDPGRKSKITKDSTHLSFEFRYEDMLGSYELRSVTVHQEDERESGHYTCFGRTGPSWHYFDDSSMREVSSGTVLASQGCTSGCDPFLIGCGGHQASNAITRVEQSCVHGSQLVMPSRVEQANKL